jgi:hypothetical protein
VSDDEQVLRWLEDGGEELLGAFVAAECDSDSVSDMGLARVATWERFVEYVDGCGGSWGDLTADLSRDPAWIRSDEIDAYLFEVASDFRSVD